ncbi:MAG: 4-hydroxy-3-methylbut-2-enyl diphosphate reductase [SAR324 cluster bacterium]|nr:4-hydroxy-3-methylbut-2-enyl diphosphate reductase [SAR324 cluster bacterium]
MKHIIVAEDQGFCWGVRRALDIVNQHGEVNIFGDLIHNKQVVEELEKKGKTIIHQITGQETNLIVITAHGTPIENFQKLNQLKLENVDTTCPLVSAIYRAGKGLEKEGYKILILGDKKHIEVKGIASRMVNPIIINNEAELGQAVLPEKIGVICQSTFSMTRFAELVSLVHQRCSDVKIRNTICAPTKKRQIAAEKLAKQVDIMIVVGGFHSSNTKKLVELTRTYVDSHHIETAAQLDPEWFRGKTEVGITSGASTADWIVEEICQKIRRFD